MPASPKKTAAEKKSPARKKPADPRSAYHHGNLKEALIEAALALLAEGGPENVTLREAGNRAGVSSGAPFRHFATRTALMTAIAEHAMHRLRSDVEAALERSAVTDPLSRLKVIGHAYLRWAIGNPALFLVVSDRRLIDFDGSESLRLDNAVIQDHMAGLLEQAERSGALRTNQRSSVPLIARALSYGLARMYVDGHMPQWGIKRDDAARAMESAVDQFVDSIASEDWLRARRRKASS